MHLHFRSAIVWLAVASFYFYADWALRYLPLFLGSALFNFGVGRVLETHEDIRKQVLVFGITVNLGLLIFFKYTNFIVDQLLGLVGIHFPSPGITLPIGISFFTFTQIAYLVDLSRGVCGRYDLWRYLLFVSFFPHLLAGPILHHREMMPQFSRRLPLATYERQIAFGLLIFAIGLFKKVWLADSIAPYANAAFDAAGNGAQLSAAAAWWGALAYTFQLYFDFSGYSDMAIGSARLLGVRLPYNFNAPYRANNIIDFWRRWHMTLSRFLRDYLYIALGGSRRGPLRRYANLLTTMTLGGIWHGAGYGFAIWGLFHGALLALNHLWRAQRRRIDLRVCWVERAAGWALTFICVVIGWVLFRATTIEGSGQMLAAMAGLSQVSSSDVTALFEPTIRALKEAPRALLAWSLLDLATLNLPTHPILGSMHGMLWLAPLMLIAVLGPTSQQCVTRIILLARSAGVHRAIALTASATLALTLLLCLYRLNHVTEFLYFQF